MGLAKSSSDGAVITTLTTSPFRQTACASYLTDLLRRSLMSKAEDGSLTKSWPRNKELTIPSKFVRAGAPRRARLLSYAYSLKGSITPFEPFGGCSSCCVRQRRL